ncbi:MAG: ribosome silencing factor [Clostridia bacterium]|nr:ribosome silencing factor [Clostridia bacterium]
MTPNELLKVALKAADGKLATDIEVLDIHELTTIADYFVICNGNSATQIRAIAEEVELKCKEAGEMPLSTEGYQASSWVLLDFGSVVVHIFRKEMREFYSIERLWNEAPRLDVKALLGE